MSASYSQACALLIHLQGRLSFTGPHLKLFAEAISCILERFCLILFWKRTSRSWRVILYSLTIVKQCFISFLNFYFRYLIETLYVSCFEVMRLFTFVYGVPCMSCCFKSSSLILTVILCLTTKSIKLLVVKRKILCYAGEGSSPLLRPTMPRLTQSQKQFSKPVAALLLLAKAEKSIRESQQNIVPHTQPFYCSSGICPGLPGWAGTRKVKSARVKPIWIYWSKR